MKNWKRLLLIFGGLLFVAGLVIYIGQVTSCYPSAAAWNQLSADEKTAFAQECRLKASPASRFADFLTLSVPGLVLFSAYWLSLPPRPKTRRGPALAAALIMMMLVCLFIFLVGMLAYPVPGSPGPGQAWVGEVMAVLAVLGYLGLLGLWRMRRWGGMAFQGAAVALAAFLLLGGGSRLLAGILVLGVVIVAVLLRSARHSLA